MLTTRSFTKYVMALALGILPASMAASASLAQYGRTSFSMGVGVFYDELDPYGDWIDYEDYGYVFAPRVSSHWRPYTEGRWVWTHEYGWLWVSEEPFGWATYHYGRWMPSRYGWLWVPGYEWGPAWVSWRSGGDYVGWAPLPPRARWQVGVGFDIGHARFDSFIGERDYNFVPINRFADYRYDRIADHVVPVERNITIINVTQNITNYSTEERRVVNRGIDPERVRQQTGREIRRVRVQQVSDVREARQARVRGEQVEVFAPEVQKKADRQPRRAIARTEIQQSRVLAERAQRQEQRRREIETREAAERKKAPDVATQRERAQPEQTQQQRQDERRETEHQRDAEQQRDRQQTTQRQREEQQQETRERQQAEQRQRDEEREARQQADQRQRVQQQEARERQQVEQQRDKQKAEQDKKAADKKAAEKKKQEEKRKQNAKEKDKPAEEDPRSRR